MRYLLLGGSGILGSGYRAALLRRSRSGLDAALTRLPLDWDHPAQAARRAAAALVTLAQQEEPLTILWAAGIGQVGTTTAAMAPERVVLDAVCSEIAGLPAGQQRVTRLVLASSAGALFAGHPPDRVIDESTEPAPISAYGEEKLAQESLCRSVARAGGPTVLICRYANLYGLAAGRMPQKGLIPAAIRAARLRTAMTIYVSPDTRRDYVYGPDAAETTLVLAEAMAGAGAGAPGGGTATALVAAGETTTVAGIITTVGSIVGRRVPATFAVRPETDLQPRTLRFRPGRGLAGGQTPLSVAVHRMVNAPAA